ncbi:MAG TPA: diadenylate cyclase [Deferrisomatales bacterium]|nr:diadenylate cyclase [Deferrisomatales bacterium]
MTPSLLLRELLDWRVYPDVIVLAIMAFLLYRTLRAMGTWKIALGLALAAVVFLLASLLDLRGVAWIFSNLSQVTLIAFLVVFQPEIRKILERAAPLRWGKLGHTVEQLPFLIDEALFALAERHWGALVVLPGHDSVQAWASQGIKADATPSFPLLLSVFDPNSPGHDGAAVIAGGRLTRFAVRLPLSESRRLSERLGTRHHAAMGLSEATDALVIAVSEERGTISMFQNGEMTAAGAKGEVAARIRSHWADPSRPAATLPRRRWAPLVEVAGSLLVAVLFWSTVVLSRTETREMFVTVPVEYARLPADLTLSGERPREAKLHVAGPASTLNTLDVTAIRVAVDLSQAAPGSQRMGLDETDVRLPRNLRLISLEPEVLDLEFRSVQEREIPIQAQLVGTPPAGRQVASVVVNPPSVRILLPEETDRPNAVTVMTAPIYLPAFRESARVVAKVVAPVGVLPADRRWPDVEVFVTMEPSAGSAPR